jgi:hypothetical protein
MKPQLRWAYHNQLCDRPGIKTSLRHITSGQFANKKAAVGYREASSFPTVPSTWSGQPVPDATTLLFKYTFRGDAYRDGDVDLDDIGRYSLNFTGELGGSGPKVWWDGDWDYDGDLDFEDAGIRSLNFTGELGGGGLGPMLGGEGFSSSHGGDGALESQVFQIIDQMQQSDEPELLVAELMKLLGVG